MAHYMCIGDQITLFCEETSGYVFNVESSTTHNQVYVYNNQSRDKPKEIPNPLGVTWEICVKNRYKFDKSYRTLKEKAETLKKDSLELKARLVEAKLAADAEHVDNEAEQNRQKGRRLRYGQIIQLRHQFTKKYLHVSTTNTSLRDKNYMMVSLHEYNAKHTQFKILPRYKVKSEGDIVQTDDQIVLESVKSAGQFLHCSAPWQIDNWTFGSELNLGGNKAGFTISKYHTPKKQDKYLVKGGSIVRLFHKELEAYLTAEGVFRDQVTEDIHLRIRTIDQSRPKSAFPSTSSITYWQIEAEEKILSGDVIRWQQQIRLRHMTTRLYLCVQGYSGKLVLTEDSNHPGTVFRLHAVVQDKDEIEFEMYCRIEHVLTGRWLHAHKDDDYIRQNRDLKNGEEQTVLKWDNAQLRQISAITECMYDDAFTLQYVNEESVDNFNKMSGMVPFVLNLLHEVTTSNSITPRSGYKALTAMKEIKEFIIINGSPNKDRQKLLRNLKIIDLLVRFLKIDFSSITRNEGLIKRITVEAYDVIETYLLGDSRKNELYFARYINYFSSQFNAKGEIGLRATQMLTELVKDNQKIIDRVSERDIQAMVTLVKQKRNFRYLDYLGMLCVCNGTAMTNNQNIITRLWLEHDKTGIYLTELGEKVGKSSGHMYVSTDGGSRWAALQEFAKEDTSDDYLFLEHQLELFVKLCYGRNDYAVRVITKDLGYLTWEEAFTCLKEEQLPAALRAHYCHVIIGMFVDVGANRSVLDQMKLSFVYEEIGQSDPFQKYLADMPKDIQHIFPELRDWIMMFLDNNKDMTASEIGQNMLIEQVLKLLGYLVRYGYYTDQHDIDKLLTPLLSMLDGTNDKPHPYKKSEGKEVTRLLQRYRTIDRFKQSPQAQAVVSAKLEALQVVELLMDLQFQVRLDKLIAIFKNINRKGKSKLAPMLNTSAELLNNHGLTKKANALLDEIFDATTIFKHDRITDVLMDLSKYEYDDIIRMSMKLLIKFNSSRADLFEKAVKAQVLITPASEQVHRLIAQHLPVIKMMAKAKLTDAQTVQVQQTLQQFTILCHLENEPDERHAMNQNILVNHGILDVIFDILSHRVDFDAGSRYEGMRNVMKTSLKLARNLTKGNHHVQLHMFGHLDYLLAIKGVDTELALALTEIFDGNQTTCLKVHSRQIQKIVHLAAEHLDQAPEYLDLLCAIVKVEELNLPLKRNQDYVMKHVMQQYNKLAYILDKTHEQKIAILLGKEGPAHLSYLISLVDLFATCAEGENRLIESMCQNIFTVDELVAIIDDRSINNNLKRPFLRFLLWVYLNTASNILESGVVDLPGKLRGWFEALKSELHLVTNYVQHHQRSVKLLLKKQPPKSQVQDTAEGRAYGTLHFLFDAAFPLIQVFFEKRWDYSSSPDFSQIVDPLANTLVNVSDNLADLVSDKNQMETMVQCVNSILMASTLSTDVIAGFIERHQISGEIQPILSDVQEQYYETYAEEQRLNKELNVFATNYSVVYKGRNTVREQTGFHSDQPYSDIGTDDEMPLGKEFQVLVYSFVGSYPRFLERCSKLIQQLWISSHKLSLIERNSEEQVQLDLRCLQVMRALIHNEMVKLPVDWEDNIDHNTPQLEMIESIQDELNHYDAVMKTLSLVERQNDDIVKEYLSFLASMLFNANVNTQHALENYCLKTRDEMFFNTVQEKIHISIQTTKERRFLAAQFESRRKDAEARAQTLRATLGKSGHRIQNDIGHQDKLIKKEELDYEGSEDAHLRIMALRAQNAQNGTIDDKKQKGKKKIQFQNQGYQPDVAVGPDTSSGAEMLVQQPDEGHVELLLKVLAGMCDGQNAVLQNYLREQPDNIKSTNLVAETITFLSHVYSNITQSSITLVIQIFDSLIEFISGNTSNQHVLFDNNIVDYINFILRSDKYTDCSPDQVLALKDSLGKLLGLMIHENKSGSSTLLLELRDTLDAESIHKVSVQCFQSSKTSVEGSLREKYLDVGFIYHFLLERLVDISPGKTMEGICTKKEQTIALKFYRRNCKSIEIIKDDQLQKVRFRVRDEKVLRDEVKQMLKWNVDRSSPSNKIRELMEWSKDIIEDIYYQRRVRSHRVLAFFIVFWSFFNKSAILLSVAINIVMVATWESRGAYDKRGVTNGVLDEAGLEIETEDQIPADIDDLKPDIRGGDWYFTFIIIIGVVHNIVSLCVLISYLISNRPKIPTWKMFTDKSKSVIGIKTKSKIRDEANGEDELDPEDKIIVKKQRMLNITRTIRGKKGKDNGRDFDSQLRAEFVSFNTLYYFAFFLFSVAGTVTYGYFFAFHLLNIVYNNQILQRVIQAVTQNGKSLLWVTILGVIVIYIFALVAFATLRENMDPSGEQSLYCRTLGECTVTILRYGLIGELFEFMKPQYLSLTFQNFGLTTIFHLMFFIIITTIGLNIIFGIILDTFSELRTMKFSAEHDMNTVCFICNRGSYEFESHGQGFEHHIDHDHNMWAYIFFFIHLDSTKPNDYTNIEDHVAKMIQNGKYDFFPVGKALALSSKDEDLTETKLDEIMKNVHILLKAHQRQIIEKERKQEQEKQKKWEAKHREAIDTDGGEEM